MNDDVIPLNEIGKIETVKVYNQSYVNKQQKRIAELEEKISILLSCKNCPDNKGGLLCQKEYEDKCLAQKIQYIKELKEENAELKAYNEKLLDGDIEKHNKIVALEQENNKLKEKIEHLTKHLDYQDICDLFKQVEEEFAQKQKLKKLELENAELKEILKPENCLKLLAKDGYIKFTSEQLTEAKEIIRALLFHLNKDTFALIYETKKESIEKAEQFLKE